MRRFGGVWMTTALALAAGSLGPKSLDAQDRHEIASGSPVRLTVKGSTPSGKPLRLEGRLVRLDADSVVVTEGKLDHAAAMDQLLTIEARSKRGCGRGALRGLGWGASVGASAGALVGWLNPDDDPAGSGLFMAIALGAFGGGISAAIGAAWPGERWVEVPTAHPERNEDEIGP